MDRIIEGIFKKRVVAFEKLLQYGFTQNGEEYEYKTYIYDDQMELTVIIDSMGNISAKVVELDTNEPYTLFLVEDAVGSFVCGVREAYEKSLTDIAEKCCSKRVFKSKYADDVIKYVRDKYGDELEFLWEKFDDNAIWRRKDNKKWYGALLTAAKNKIGLDGEEKMEIIDLRINPQEVESIVDSKRYFPAYHMNKKSWITICLEGSCELQEIYKRIDESYDLAKKK